MVFSSIIFLCVFLPLTLGGYYICPPRWRNLFLLIASMFFYAWGEPRYVILMLVSILCSYFSGLLLEYTRENRSVQRIILMVAIGVNLIFLGVFKYGDFVISSINSAFHSDLGMLSLALPIGISFYTFQAISYIVDVYRGDVKAQPNIITFGMYIAMFPQLIAGPIVRYSDIEKEFADRRVKVADMSDGICRFIIGLGKKVLFANQIGALWTEISTYQGTSSMLLAWLGAIAFTFQIYFDFSGYSDMAIGLGQMFGFTFPENFHYPYESKSVTEFWRRWHMTLGTWFREYVYIPLGGNRHGLIRQAVNLFLVWTLTGLWHGAGWNFLAWGFYYFLILLLEKSFVLKMLRKVPGCIQHVYTMILVVIGWVLFACDDSTVLVRYIKSMFGANGFYRDMDLYYLFSRGILLVLLCIAVTQLPKKALQWLRDNMQLHEDTEFILKAIGCLVIFMLSAVFIIGENYNPFLYFRF